MTNAVRARLEALPTRRPQAPRLPLTARQREVLILKANGHTSGQIARKLGISITTVNERLHRAYTKLGADNAPQAVAIACMLRIIRPGDIKIPAELTGRAA